MTLIKPSSERVAGIKNLQNAAAAAVGDSVAEGGEVLLLDFPDHDNIGDSAIFVGELNYLRKMKANVVFMSTIENHDWKSFEQNIGDRPILLHGGGNFGDLWPWFHAFREEVITRFPGRPILQFPQTVFYRDQEHVDRTARMIERHGAFTLLVRDQRSFDFARRSFQCEVRLSPDMAYFIGPVNRKAPTHNLLLHLRQDQEAAEPINPGALGADPRVLVSDWPGEEASFRSDDQRRRALGLALAYAKGGRAGYLAARYRGLAETRLARGFNLLSRGKSVITDRLHGHIMSYLLDLPQCVLDNSYGKTSTYMDAWGTLGGNVARAGSFAEAEAWYRGLDRQ